MPATIFPVVITFILAAAVNAQAAAGRACNNAAKLCDQPYNNITHLGAHNSPFLRDESTGFSSSGNHFFDSVVQLDAGVRVLTAQLHVEEAEGTAGGANLRLCHASCSLLDAGLFSEWLGSIKQWMDGNPDEVVTIIIVNADEASTADIAAAYEASGIVSYGYVPDSPEERMQSWPTLGDLINANTRLVTFVASLPGGDYDPSAPYLINEFTHVFETQFEVTDPVGFNCDIHRPDRLLGDGPVQAISDGHIPLMNHFLGDDQLFGIITPAVDSVNVTNSPEEGLQGSLGDHAVQCTQQWGRAPAIILVDFFNVGPAIATVDALNDVTQPGDIVGRKEVAEALLDPNSSGATSLSLHSAGCLKMWFGLLAIGFVGGGLW